MGATRQLGSSTVRKAFGLWTAQPARVSSANAKADKLKLRFIGDSLWNGYAGAAGHRQFKHRPRSYFFMPRVVRSTHGGWKQSAMRLHHTTDRPMVPTSTTCRETRSAR